MVSNISSCTKVLVLPIVLWVVSSFSLRAQEKDFATWANAGFEYKLKPAFTVSGGLEWRTKDDLGKTDRWGLKVGGSYKLLPFLKLGAGYETHYRNRGADGWKFRHRYRLEGTLSARVQRVMSGRMALAAACAALTMQASGSSRPRISPSSEMPM